MNLDYDDMDPTRVLRSDLWSQMTVAELAHQQDLALTKLSTLSSIIGASSPPQYQMLYSSIQQALSHINSLIDARSQQGKSRKEING